MIIVSQDKRRIINLNSIAHIFIFGKPREQKEYRIGYGVMNNNYEELGTYATEERAKEVLKEIIDSISIKKIENCSYEYADLAIKIRKFATYEMPKE